MDYHMVENFTMFRFLFLSASLFFPLTAFAQDSARDIVRRADDKYRGKTSQGIMTMTITRPDWSRTVTMKSWSKGRDYTLVLITAPAKEKGQAFLKRKNEMWQWAPAIDRMIKIPPSMMMQPWLGSDFTNDDLLKESSILFDYSHLNLGMEEIRGHSCHKIELTPLPDAAVVWGKIFLWIDQESYDHIQSKFYDEEGEPVHTEHFSDIRQMGDRRIPTRMEIIPEDKPGHRTALVLEEMVYDKPFADTFFSIQNLKRIR